MSLLINPPPGTPAFIVDETLPTGFTANNISSAGGWNSANETITWRPFFDGSPCILSYSLVPPSGFSGTASLTGQALLFGATATTGGQGTVFIGNPPARPILELTKVEPGLFGVSITGALNQLYRLDAAQNLTSGNWTPLVTISLTQSPFTFVDLGSVTNSTRFYRITVVP